VTTIGADPTTQPDQDDDQDEPRRRDVDRLFRSQDFPMPQALRERVHDAAERIFGAPEAAPFKPGDRLAAYRIVRLLGGGGQGWVYEAVHEALNRPVAIKIPRPDVADRIMHEARLTAQLEHPHIVRVEDVVADRDVPFLVMERCTGGSLDQLMERYPTGLPLADVRAIARATLEALQFAHGRGIIHRDVKPANILFDGRGLTKLSDLGIGTISAAGADLQHSGDMTKNSVDGPMGTPMFVAPEQEDPSRLRGEALDGRADLFAFGKTLFVMLTGASPRTIRPPSRMRRGLDPLWDDLVFKLVEESRERRFASAAQALEFLASIPEPAPLAISATPVEQRAPRRRAGNIFFLAGLSSAAFAALLEVKHATLAAQAVAAGITPLKVGALLGGAFLLWFSRLERRSAQATSVAAALLLSVLLAGWAPAAYATLGALSPPIIDIVLPLAAGTMTFLGLGCAMGLFPRAPARAEVRVRPKRVEPERAGFFGLFGRFVGALLGAAASFLSAILGVAAFVAVAFEWREGVAWGGGLLVAAAAAGVFSIAMVVSLVRRLIGTRRDRRHRRA
jgi:serine/threonine protein kinase